jgi:NAD-dependent SIR2 family protein deacetylase
MSGIPETWCERDQHKHFDCFIDFNDWLDSGEDEAKAILVANGVSKVSQPSKALFAGDREAYDQVFKEYRNQRRHEVLSGEYIVATFGDDHWFERNEQRFDQLVSCLLEDSVVPFIGAGVSVAGGFPTWKDHLRQQGKTAGIAADTIEAHLAKGEYEAVIETIESTRGADVFAQEIRDAFSKTGSLEDITLRISELFSDTLITTNYDHLLEQCFDIGPGEEVQVINSTGAMEQPDPDKVTIIKLHGDILAPQRCILGKNQYDEAYGKTDIDLTKPIPKLLRYHYTTSSLLFIGCSLNNDRTIQVFKAVKAAIGDGDRPEHFSIEQAPENVTDLIARNAELLGLGITSIWYPKGEYDKVEAILRHASNELNYKKSGTPRNGSPRGVGGRIKTSH